MFSPGRDVQPSRKILGIQEPWCVQDMEVLMDKRRVEVHASMEDGAQLVCPKCGSACPGYDSRRREFRHLDTCRFQTFIVANLSRVRCPEHSFVMVDIP